MKKIYIHSNLLLKIFLVVMFNLLAVKSKIINQLLIYYTSILIRKN